MRVLFVGAELGRGIRSRCRHIQAAIQTRLLCDLDTRILQHLPHEQQCIAYTRSRSRER